jgi:ribonucleoside-triphosphate reductase
LDDYQKFIHYSRYSRWRDDLGRRETWEETVERLVDYYAEQVDGKIDDIYMDLATAIRDMEVMPSMRCMMTAGPALDRCNVAAYNCAYLPVDSPRSFDEAMYILMCGTGVGYSVEEKYVSQLPRVSETMDSTDTVIKVADSKEGWSKAFRELVSLLIAGQVPSWDVSDVRPAGSILKTFGGRASGPEPLVRLFDFSVELFRKAKGRRLTPLECHDLMCMVADIVVVGGVRRSAMISLSDLGSEALSTAKRTTSTDSLLTTLLCMNRSPLLVSF